MPHESHKRRNYLIDKKFQLKYTVLTVLMLIIVTLVSGFGLYMGIWGSVIENFSKFKVSQKLENASRITSYEEARFKKGDYRIDKIFREAELLSAQDKQALKAAMRAANKSLAPKIIILSLLLFALGIFLSHKIAGPMYRIEKSAEAIRCGDLNVTFKVRKTDEMQKAAHALEDMAESLHHDIGKMKAESIALEERINMLSERGQIPEEEGKRLKTMLRSIDTILSKYKT